MGIDALMKKKAVFFDRDGVLNQAIIKNGKPYPPASLETLMIADDALAALNLLKQQAFLLIGATNQPDVARGTTSRVLVEAINTALLTKLPLDDIRVCYHDDADSCHCRKPEPGLLLAAAQDYDIDLTKSYMIGDRWKDIEAGRRAGCRTIWLDFQYREKFLSAAPNFIAHSLTQAAEWILT